jgi:chromate transporter
VKDDPLIALVLIFVPLSLLAVGGGASMLAPLHEQVVNGNAWISQREFIDLFAISRASPGPGAMLVTLVGFRIAGWAGAIVATLATFIPSSILCYGVGRVWNRYRGTRVHAALEGGLAPIGVGLVIAGAIAVLRAAEAGPLGWGVAIGATVILILYKIHPLWILACGGLVFATVGWL